jgi:diguanylate cyclase (GGDEF)-like protein
VVVLSRRLKIGIALSLALVLGVAAFFNHRGAAASLIELEERNNVAVARTLANTVYPAYADIAEHPVGVTPAELRVRPQTEGLTKAVVAATRGLSVVKVKVYSTQGLTVFSSDAKQIGESQRDNPGFRSALLGTTTSTLVHRDAFDAFESRLTDTDLVATYTPITDAKGRPTAVFEVYSDVTHLKAAQTARAWTTLAVAGGVVGLLYVLALLAMRLVAERHRQEEREAGDRRARHQAFHDEMTGLPNRQGYIEYVSRAVKRAEDEGNKLAVVSLDLDRFKLINDSMGHKVGDKLLRHLARRLKALLPKGEKLFRIGGDEFGIVLTSHHPAKDATELVQRILASVAGTMQINDRSIAVAMSAGVTVFPDDSSDGSTLIRNADAAMYSAKAGGGNRYLFFKQDMSARAGRQLELESGVRRALKAGEFELYYQPRHDAQKGHIVGAEALLRWRSPKDGKFIPPDEFVPTLEDTGLINAVGRWALVEACIQAQSWGKQKGKDPVRVSVNVSPKQFNSEDFVESVSAALRRSGLVAERLELELTERLLCGDTEAAVAKMETLKRMGVKLSIDDFGTGYSSLSYLQRFPVDCLKIDKSFVRDITKGPREAAIALAIIDLAHNLELTLVAEGVEQESQAQFLRERGCRELQGYLFSRPLSAKQVAHRIKAMNGPDKPISVQGALDALVGSSAPRAVDAGPTVATEFQSTTMQYA